MTLAPGQCIGLHCIACCNVSLVLLFVAFVADKHVSKLFYDHLACSCCCMTVVSTYKQVRLDISMGVINKQAMWPEPA